MPLNWVKIITFAIVSRLAVSSPLLICMFFVGIQLIFTAYKLYNIIYLNLST